MTLRISNLKYNTLNRLEMFFLSIVKNVPQPIAVKIGARKKMNGNLNGF